MKVTILFYPDPLLPKPLSRVYRILQGVDWIDYHNDPTKPHDLHIFWSYTKSKIVPDDITLLSTDVINRGCWDITKQKVNDIFNDLSVDPKNYHGICVEKLEMQGSHRSHRLIHCPAEPKQGFIYQKFIENKEGNLYFKYRVCYADGVKLVIKKYNKSIFASDYVDNIEVPKQDLFTPEQERDLVQKCQKFGVDFAELDVMIYEGQPVVIDVNNVVGGGHINAESGTQVSDDMDETFFDFIRSRCPNLSSLFTKKLDI